MEKITSKIKRNVFFMMVLSMFLSFNTQAANIYLDGVSGDDSHGGTSTSDAVKTFAKAKLLMSSGDIIYICGTVSVSGTENWNLSGKDASGIGYGTVMRSPAYQYALIEVTGSLNLNNIIVDGGSGSMTAQAPILVVKANGTVNLKKNCTLQNNKNLANLSGGIASVEDGGSLTMTWNSKITNGYSNDGGGVYNEGSFVMNGGTSVENCTANRYGGGIYLKGANATATVDGNNATISNNTTVTNGGAGVFIGNSATFNFVNGTISGNITQTTGGAGVHIVNNATFNMSGGTIKKNISAANGGGVSLYSTKGNSSTFNMTGGSIFKNAAANDGGGVFVPKDKGSNINVSGNIIITNNISNNPNVDTPANNDVYLNDSRTINVTGALTGHIGVAVLSSKHNIGYDFATGIGSYNVTESDADVFFDNYAYPLTLGTGKDLSAAAPGAIYFVQSYFVFYDGHGNTGGTAPIDYTAYDINDIATVMYSGTLTKTGAVFDGWTMIPSSDIIINQADTIGLYGTVPGRKLTIEKTITLYAVWAKDVNGNGIPDRRENLFPDPIVMRYVDMPLVDGVETTPNAGFHYVLGNKDFSFTASYLDETPFTVKATGYYTGKENVLTAKYIGGGVYQYVIKDVTEPWSISFVSSDASSGTVSNESVTEESTDGISVWSYDNVLYIRSNANATAYIYNISGTLYKRFNVSEGNTSETLPRGIYVVVVGNSRYKVIIK